MINNPLKLYFVNFKMSERNSTGNKFHAHVSNFTIHAAQTERQRLSNTQIIVKKTTNKIS